jgi:hypothetical protein
MELKIRHKIKENVKWKIRKEWGIKHRQRSYLHY